MRARTKSAGKRTRDNENRLAEVQPVFQQHGWLCETPGAATHLRAVLYAPWSGGNLDDHAEILPVAYAVLDAEGHYYILVRDAT